MRFLRRSQEEISGFDPGKFYVDARENYRADAQRRRAREDARQAEPGDMLDGAETSEGKRIRIVRRLAQASQQNFRPLSKALELPHERKVIKRRPLGNIALTVFDSQQLSVTVENVYTRADLHDRFRSLVPRSYETRRIKMLREARKFGGSKNIHWGLQVEEPRIFEDQRIIQDFLAPNSDLNPDAKLHVPHISLAKMLTQEGESVPLSEHIEATGELINRSLLDLEIGRTAVVGPLIIEFLDPQE